MEEVQLHYNLSGKVKGSGCKITGTWNVCWHGPGKSMFRPESVLVAGTHKPSKMNDAGIATQGIMEDSEL